MSYFEDVEKSKSENLIKWILKYRNVDNMWKQRCFRILRDRHNLDISDKHYDTEENLKIIEEELPEYFI